MRRWWHASAASLPARFASVSGSYNRHGARKGSIPLNFKKDQLGKRGPDPYI
jgi:hypothetical protein